MKKAMRKRSLLAVLLVLCMVVMLMAAAVAGTAVLYRKKAKNQIIRMITLEHMNDILHAGTDKKADGKNTAFFF